MAGDSWYYAFNNAQQGPVSLDQLRQLIAVGELGAESLVWREGMAEWAAAESVPGLFQGAAVRPNIGAGNDPSSVATDEKVASSGDYSAPWMGHAEPALMGGQLNYFSTVPDPYAYAGFWLRFAAYLIDYIILSAFGWIVASVVRIAVLASGLQTGSSPLGTYFLRPAGSRGMNGAILAIGLLSQMLVLIGRWLYYGLMEASAYQGTLGKMAIGIKVTDLSGKRIAFGRATGRFFGKILSWLLLGIGFLMIGGTDRKQGLHDQMAGTLVLRKGTRT